MEYFKLKKKKKPSVHSRCIRVIWEMFELFFFRDFLDTVHAKRKRTTTKVLDVESDREEHSLSLSQNSSVSLSDQENTGIHKVADSVVASQGFNLFQQLTQRPCNEHALTGSSNQKEFGNAFPITSNDVHLFGNSQTLTRKEQYLHAQIDRERFQLPLVDQKPLEGGPIHNLVIRLHSLS